MLDPLLNAPDGVFEIVNFAVQTSPIGGLLLAAMCFAIGWMLAILTRPVDAPFITVECPEDVRAGQSFVVEFESGRTALSRGRKRRTEVIAPRTRRDGDSNLSQPHTSPHTSAAC